MKTTIKQNLYSEVHGTCSGQNGYVVAITRVIKIGIGKIQEDTGFAVFPVTFSAIVFRPFKNEILETLVTGINNTGIFTSVGPMTIFISRQAGISSEWHFDEQDECYVSDDGRMKIEKNDELRVKLTGYRLSTNNISGIGTIKEDFLGPIL